MIYYRHTDLLLSLLRLALWGDKAPFEALQPIGEEEWRVAFFLAASHTVQGLAWQGICMLQDGELPPQDLLCLWAAKAEKLEQASAGMNETLASLTSLLQANDLHPVVLKGQCVAALYDHPALRECGDIDLYFPSSQEFARSKEVLPKCKHTSDGCYRSFYKGTEVEVHPRFIDISSPFANAKIRRMAGKQLFTQVEAAPGLALTGLAPEANILSLSAHIMKHSFGRGIGLRQMCDLAAACKSYHGSIDAGKMAITSKKLGLERWHRMLYSFLVLQLGMPREYLPYPMELSQSHSLAHRVLYGGNFGRMALDQKGSGLARKGQTACSLIKNSFWALGCAPAEAFFHFWRLALGQFKI